MTALEHANKLIDLIEYTSTKIMTLRMLVPEKEHRRQCLEIQAQLQSVHTRLYQLALALSDPIPTRSSDTTTVP